MNFPNVNWMEINSLEGAELKQAVFTLIQAASRATQSEYIDEPHLLETVPRLTNLLENKPEVLASFKPLVSSLARSVGLWNYIDKEFAEKEDVFIAEAVTASELGGITFHREQIEALNVLMDGRNLILSAPTSFGKSLLVDALLATDRYKRIAIVLPTIALLDEFRRRFKRRFKDKYNIVMQPNDEASGEATIFLGTQERLVYRDDIGHLDLTVVDEFYKLDPERQDDRSVTLNAAVYKLLKRSRQFFFLGPNIDGVTCPQESRWKFEFLKTRFSTVAVDTLDLSREADKKERLIDELGEDENWPALVFVSSPDKANKLAMELSEGMAVSDTSNAFAEWLRDNVGPNGLISEAAQFGFGIHHGRVPRAIAGRMVKLFNDGVLPILLCTSTLIEGVNTAAKTVMIYDKQINRSNYDFFTFSNIRGRAGRLGQHHVGRVMLFNDAPKRTDLEVNPTLFDDEEQQPDEYLIHIDDEDRSQQGTTRIDAHMEALGLTPAELRLASSLGLDKAYPMKEKVEEALRKGADLVWSGKPKYKQIQALVDVIGNVEKIGSFGAVSKSQLTFLINEISKPQTFRNFLLKQDQSYTGSPEKFDSIFNFLRACEYGLGQHVTLAECFIKQNEPDVDYSYFIAGLASWFRPSILKELDEEGIPIQISERFIRREDTKNTLRERLIAFAKIRHPALTNFEMDWLLDSS